MKKKSTTLNFESKLLLDSRQFFSQIVEDGFLKRKINTYPAVQNYIVGLLQHYLDAKNLFESEVDESGNRKPSTLAEMYLLASNMEGSERQGLLKKMGDRSLYICGFFGESLTKKIVDIDYYAHMGGAAYGSLAGLVQEDTTAKIYKVFSQRFLDFVDVLAYISQQTMVQSDQNVLHLYDRYLQTGSEVARDKLIEMGVLTVPQHQRRLIKQD